VLLCALAGAACTHQVQTASHRPARNTVPTIPVRHTQNVVDTGEGDIEIANLRHRLAADANDMDARILLARLYTRRGLPDLALEHYRLGSALFPGSVVVTLELAKALHASGETGQALKAARACLDKHPEGSWELLSLAGIFEDELGQWAEAEVSHRAALALAPGRSPLHNNLGYNLLLQGKLEDAAAEFHNAIKADPLSAIAHNNLGDVLAKQARFNEALAEWQLVGGPAVAHNNLAASLMAAGRYPEARAEIALALKFRHDFPAAYLNLRLVAERDGLPATISGAGGHE